MSKLLERNSAILLVIDVQERINSVMVDQSHLPRIEVLNRRNGLGRGSSLDWYGRQDRSLLVRGLNSPEYGNTIPINDPEEYRRRKEHERFLRRQLIEGLKQSGVRMPDWSPVMSRPIRPQRSTTDNAPVT